MIDPSWIALAVTVISAVVVYAVSVERRLSRLETALTTFVDRMAALAPCLYMRAKEERE